MDMFGADETRACRFCGEPLMRDAITGDEAWFHTTSGDAMCEEGEGYATPPLPVHRTHYPVLC